MSLLELNRSVAKIVTVVVSAHLSQHLADLRTYISLHSPIIPHTMLFLMIYSFPLLQCYILFLQDVVPVNSEQISWLSKVCSYGALILILAMLRVPCAFRNEFVTIVQIYLTLFLVVDQSHSQTARFILMVCLW